jgi:hypothetical protein
MLDSCPVSVAGRGRIRNRRPNAEYQGKLGAVPTFLRVWVVLAHSEVRLALVECDSGVRAVFVRLQFA